MLGDLGPNLSDIWAIDGELGVRNLLTWGQCLVNKSCSISKEGISFLGFLGILKEVGIPRGCRCAMSCNGHEGMLRITGSLMTIDGHHFDSGSDWRGRKNWRVVTWWHPGSSNTNHFLSRKNAVFGCLSEERIRIHHLMNLMFILGSGRSNAFLQVPSWS